MGSKNLCKLYLINIWGSGIMLLLLKYGGPGNYCEAGISRWLLQRVSVVNESIKEMDKVEFVLDCLKAVW